jgi:putative tricarboxylic transport membrane protein
MPASARRAPGSGAVSGSDGARNAGDRLAARLAGLAVAGFGAALWLWIIPWQVDAVDYGWMRPRTLPTICAVGLLVAGLALAAFPAGATDLSPRRSLKAAALLALMGVAVWAMDRWGFLVAAPFLAAILVAILRERRWPWILAAIAAVPGLIWLAVVPLLGRGLP